MKRDADEPEQAGRGNTRSSGPGTRSGIRPLGAGIQGAVWLGVLGLLVFGGSLEAWAQRASVGGVVQEASRQGPLSGAHVLLVQPGTETMIRGEVTDAEGRYMIRDLASGAYELVVHFVGYREARIALRLVAGEALTVDVALTPGIMKIDPIVVTASRRAEKALEAPASISVLEAEALAQDAAPSPVAALRAVPGVDLQQAGINRYQVAVRGFSDNYTSRVHPLVDYRDMHSAAFNDAFYMTMPIHTLDLARIEVVRGPNSALYGPGVDQGVIHFLTKDPFTYPGTSFALEAGERQIFGGAFRHAGVIGDRLGYKVVGHYFRGEDWQLDPNDSHDAALLDAIADSLTGLDGNTVGPLGARDYDSYAWYLGGAMHYRFNDQTTLTANLAYSRSESNFNASGEWRFDDAPSAYGQLRLQTGRLFAQAFFTASLSDEDYFNYRTGFAGFNKSTEWNLQAQYGLAFLEGREDLTLGIDHLRAIPRTRGTLTGRNEQNDQFTSTGGYVQSLTRLSDQFDLTLSGRLDYFSATDEVFLSPRAALLFKPTPEHTLRLTYNRASGQARALAYFMDFVTDDRGAFLIRLRGAASAYTFSDPLKTSSFIALPGLPGQDPGVGILLARAYAASTAGLTAPEGPLAGAAPELQDLLWSRMAQIEGFSEGQLLLGGEIVSNVHDRAPLRLPITNTFEFGYKGLLGGRVLLGVDVYYTRKERFFGFHTVTPLVLVPGVSHDLAGAVEAAFTDEELSAFGLTVEDLTQMYAAAGADLSKNPVGLVEPEENFDPETRPELLLVNGNFGDVDYFGADLSVEANMSDRLKGFFNYAWVSDNYFGAEELHEPGSGFVVSMNAPREKARFGLAYAVTEGLRLQGSVRYVKSFRVVDDFYIGRVDAYTLVDLGGGYDFSRYVPGLRLDVTAQNVSNHWHREYIGVPKIGRLVTARLTYAW